MAEDAPEYLEILHGSPEWEEAVELRQDVLRTPLSLRFSEAQLAAEGPPERHVVARVGGVIVGTAIVVPLDAATVKVRQVAVRADQRGTGLGRGLMQRAEEVARAAGFRTVRLHARLVVRDFYEKLGYVAEGGVFEEIGIPHTVMTKALE